MWDSHPLYNRKRVVIGLSYSFYTLILAHNPVPLRGGGLFSPEVASAKEVIYEEDSNEISEIKSFYQVTQFFDNLQSVVFKGEVAISKLFKKIINVIRRLGIKSKKKGKKTVNQILEYMKISSDDLASMVI